MRSQHETLRGMTSLVLFGRLPASSEILRLLLDLNVCIPYAVTDGGRKYKPRDDDLDPLEVFAAGLGIPVVGLEEFEEISRPNLFDLGIAAGFGKKLSGKVLSSFRHGVINFHTGLLPSYAGLFSEIHTLLNGEKYGGVTAHWANEIIDGGRLIRKKRYEINATDTVFDLFLRGQDTTVILFKEIMNLIENPAELSQSGAFLYKSKDYVYYGRHSIAGKKHIGEISNSDLHLELDAANLMRVVRAFDHPYHEPAFFTLDGQKLYLRTKIHPSS